MKKTILGAIRAILRMATYLALVAIIIVAMITCLCCFDPEQPGFVCDHPALFYASATIAVAAIASIIGLSSSGDQPKDAPKAQTRSEYTNTNTTIAKIA